MLDFTSSQDAWAITGRARNSRAIIPKRLFMGVLLVG
jgi:hypothetical protein